MTEANTIKIDSFLFYVILYIYSWNWITYCDGPESLWSKMCYSLARPFRSSWVNNDAKNYWEVMWTSVKELEDSFVQRIFMCYLFSRKIYYKAIPTKSCSLVSCIFRKNSRGYMWAYSTSMWTIYIFYGVDRCVNTMVTCLFIIYS